MSAAQASASQWTATARKHESDRIQRLDKAELDPNIVRSILQDLKISCEVQPQWKQDKEFLIQVNLEKPHGKTYLVDAIEQSCILYVNRRPHGLLRQDDHSRDVRCLLKANLGSRHPVFRIEPDIPVNSELMVEWANYNPRTQQIETLQSKPFIWSNGTARDEEHAHASVEHATRLPKRVGQARRLTLSHWAVPAPED